MRTRSTARRRTRSGSLTTTCVPAGNSAVSRVSPSTRTGAKRLHALDGGAVVDRVEQLGQLGMGVAHFFGPSADVVGQQRALGRAAPTARAPLHRASAGRRPRSTAPPRRRRPRTRPGPGAPRWVGRRRGCRRARPDLRAARPASVRAYPAATRDWTMSVSSRPRRLHLQRHRRYVAQPRHLRPAGRTGLAPPRLTAAPWFQRWGPGGAAGATRPVAARRCPLRGQPLVRQRLPGRVQRHRSPAAAGSAARPRAPIASGSVATTASTGIPAKPAGQLGQHERTDRKRAAQAGHRCAEIGDQPGKSGIVGRYVEQTWTATRIPLEQSATSATDLGGSGLDPLYGRSPTLESSCARGPIHAWPERHLRPRHRRRCPTLARWRHAAADRRRIRTNPDGTVDSDFGTGIVLTDDEAMPIAAISPTDSCNG